MYQELTEILTSKFQLEGSDITPSVTLDALGLDSLDLVELALIIEKEFGAKVSDDELAEAQQLETIVGLVTVRSTKV